MVHDSQVFADSAERPAQSFHHVDPPWEATQQRPTKATNFLSKLGMPARKPVGAAGSTSQTTSSSDYELKEGQLAKDEGVSIAPTAIPQMHNLDRSSGSLKEEGGLPVAASAKPTPRDRFNSFMPPSRRYLGRSRLTFLLILLAILICLLALIIGLAVGLNRHKSSSSQNLPLPSNSGVFTGDLTYYANELGLGACGVLSAASDPICAVSHLVYDAASTSSNPNLNPLCGRMIRVTRFNSASGTNRSVDVKVIDRCVGCKADDLDLSLGAFKSVAEEAEGRVVGSWAWLA